ncbi:cadherin-7-like [Pholidichthys leucotaenia]
MSCLSILSVLSAMVLWEESGCGAMTLNSVYLSQMSGSGPRGSRGEPAEGPAVHQRNRRSWVWNQFFVLEEHTEDEPVYVGKLHSDVDRGDGQVKYTLSGEGATSVFSIDKDTGDIHAIRRLDREHQAYYTLRAQAKDRITNLPIESESQFIIKVQDINDNEPRFLDGPYLARVPERSPAGTSVVTVVATDADDPTYGNSARLVYSILEGQPYFSVEAKTGLIRTAVPDLDREVRDHYLLVVQAKDMIGQMGGLSGTTTVTVTLTDVNDNPPRFPRKSYQFRIPESVPVSSVVAKIKALDPDVGPNAEMDYRVLDGDGPGIFRILTDPATQEGLIILSKVLDFESKSSYTLRVEASNRYVDSRFLSMGPFRTVATVRLQVENVDEPPVFSLSISRMAVSEAASVGTKVGLVLAHDPDASHSPVRYSIDSRSDLGQYFDMDRQSGVIRISRPLDREVAVLHNITVVATDTSMLHREVGQAVVMVSVTDINDNAPRFAIDYQTFVCENAVPGQVIETLNAVDPDENGHHFLFSEGAEVAGSLSFILRDNHDNTASILVRQSGFLRRDQPLHFLSVVISDGDAPPLSSTNTLTITVCDCDLHGNRRHCGPDASPLLVQEVFGTVTAAILMSIFTVFGVVMMVTAAVRRLRGHPLMADDEPNVRENIVRYDDEGGGEEDTKAFDMFALRHLNRSATIATVTRVTQPPPSIIDRHHLVQEFIMDQLKHANLDLAAPPFDSLQTYALEGSWSAAESLSSLSLLSSLDSEQSFQFLREWGPRFGKLSELYGDHQDG